MGTTSPAVSVIIPTFNRIADRRLLEEHLKAHKQYPQESEAILGYTTWAPPLSVTPLMRYVTGIGRFLFAYSDLKDGQMLDFYLLLGRALLVQAVVSCQTRRF